MKKTITLLALAFLFGCGPEKTSQQNNASDYVDEYGQPFNSYNVKNGAIRHGTEYKIIQQKIDSCEYIIIFGESGRNIIHKANCKNHK